MLGKVFDTDFLPKCGVFELPLPKNAKKRTQKNQGKKNRMVGGWWAAGGGWVRDLANVRGGPSICFEGRRRKIKLKATYTWQMINGVGRYFFF
jgi:hypothetical protein